jgi:D-alanyl-D-alanine dipeptidase
MDNTIIIDLKYSTKDNFTGKVIYPFKTCLLRKETAVKLSNANELLKEKGYRLKLYDGYRPPFAQDIFWEAVKDERFVANPKNGGSIHSRGCAVDVSIVDSSGLIRNALGI